MEIGIIIGVAVLLLFAYMVFMNERNKKKRGGKEKSAKPKNDEHKKMEPRDPNQKKEEKERKKEEKERKKNEKKEKKKDTDEEPNLEGMEFSGREERRSDVTPTESEEDRRSKFVSSQMDSMYHGLSDKDPFKTKGGTDLLNGLDFSNPDERKSSRPVRSARARKASEADFYGRENEKSVGDMLANLPPEIKALMLSGVLDRRDDV